MNKLHVFHSSNTRDTMMYGMIKDSPLTDRMRIKCLSACATPEVYNHVVTLTGAKDLEAVWTALQSDTSTIPRDLRVRSLVVGDLIVNPDTMEVFIVDSCGFERFDSADAEALIERLMGPTTPIPS